MYLLIWGNSKFLQSDSRLQGKICSFLDLVKGLNDFVTENIMKTQVHVLHKDIIYALSWIISF